MSRGLIINNKIMIALKEILAHKNITYKARDSNFDKGVQVKDEIVQLDASKDEELQDIILRNRYF